MICEFCKHQIDSGDAGWGFAMTDLEILYEYHNECLEMFEGIGIA